MNDKSALAELIWLTRLKQGTFLPTQSPSESFSGLEQGLSVPPHEGEADSSLSVLNRSSESMDQTELDA